MPRKVFVTHSETQTELFAENFAHTVPQGAVIALRGDLGAGKTCFVRGFARGAGYLGDVTSPTFDIVNVYTGGRFPICHFDMYRISGWEDLDACGYFDYLEAGHVLLIEWSENIESALPENTVRITLEHVGPSDRKITVEE